MKRPFPKESIVTQDITEYGEDEQMQDSAIETGPPPLCLVHYFAERGAYPPERDPKPPGNEVGRVVERRGNLIILEFAAPPPAVRAKRQSRSSRRVNDTLMLLLLLACLLGCLAAFRF